MGKGKKIFNSLDDSAFTTGKTKVFFDLHFGKLEEPSVQVIDLGLCKIVGHPDMPRNKFLLSNGTSVVEGEINTE